METQSSADDHLAPADCNFTKEAELKKFCGESFVGGRILLVKNKTLHQPARGMQSFREGERDRTEAKVERGEI